MPDTDTYKHAARLTVDLVDHGHTPNEVSEIVLEKLIEMAHESKICIWRRGAGLNVQSVAALYRLYERFGLSPRPQIGDYALRSSPG